MYLQIGAVAIVSLLTRSTIECVPSCPACWALALTCIRSPCSDVLSQDKASVALLKAAAAKAVKSYTASPTNSTLLAASKAATLTFTAADAALTHKKVDVASLLAFFAGVFSLGIGLLKIGKVMNLMGPAVGASGACVSLSRVAHAFARSFGVSDCGCGHHRARAV